MLIVLFSVAVLCLLWAERRQFRAGVWLAKPVASALFVAIAWQAGAQNSLFGQLMFAGLVLSWLGDILLIPNRQSFFVSGLAAFLVAHLTFAAAFFELGVGPSKFLLGTGLMIGIGAVVLDWLRPHLPVQMLWPVRGYVVSIGLMVAAALGTLHINNGPWLFIGAGVFAASDVMVARQQFVDSAIRNKLIGLPLYYLAQLVLALNVVR